MPKRLLDPARVSLTFAVAEYAEQRSAPVDNLKPSTILPILYENIAQEARVLTDEGGHYKTLSTRSCTRRRQADDPANGG